MAARSTSLSSATRIRSGADIGRTGVTKVDRIIGSSSGQASSLSRSPAAAGAAGDPRRFFEADRLLVEDGTIGLEVNHGQAIRNSLRSEHGRHRPAVNFVTNQCDIIGQGAARKQEL
jgi:hypothetical protein